MAAPARRYKQFLNSLEPPMRRAFELSVQRIVAKASIGDLTDAIAASAPMDEIMRAAGVTEAAFAEMYEALREAFKVSGAFYMAAEVPSRFGMDFRMTTPRVNAWLDQRSSQLITGDLIPEQRRAVQIALSNGFERGLGPRTVALDIVGRVNSTGRRAGGLVGLSEPQAAAYVRATGELAGLDPHYFTRAMRDKRYDAMVRRAIDS